MIVARTVQSPPGKRVGQGGKIECDHPKRRGALTDDWVLPRREGDTCDVCGWREAIPIRFFHGDGTVEEVTAGELMRRLKDNQ